MNISLTRKGAGNSYFLQLAEKGAFAQPSAFITYSSIGKVWSATLDYSVFNTLPNFVQ
jgi:hypothetical protein